MLDPDVAQAFAESWYSAWNSNDLDAILAHWSDDGEFTSPWVAIAWDRPSGTVTGKEEFRSCRE